MHQGVLRCHLRRREEGQVRVHFAEVHLLLLPRLQLHGGLSNTVEDSLYFLSMYAELESTTLLPPWKSWTSCFTIRTWHSCTNAPILELQTQIDLMRFWDSTFVGEQGHPAQLWCCIADGEKRPRWPSRSPTKECLSPRVRMRRTCGAATRRSTRTATGSRSSCVGPSLSTDGRWSSGATSTWTWPRTLGKCPMSQVQDLRGCVRAPLRPASSLAGPLRRPTGGDAQGRSLRCHPMLAKSMVSSGENGGDPGTYRPWKMRHAPRPVLQPHCAFIPEEGFWLDSQRPELRHLLDGNLPHDMRRTSASACTHFCRRLRHAPRYRKLLNTRRRTWAHGRSYAEEHCRWTAAPKGFRYRATFLSTLRRAHQGAHAQRATRSQRAVAGDPP